MLTEDRLCSRRQILIGATTAGLAAAASSFVHAGRHRSHIKSVIRREETTLRLGGMGDNYHMSWGADDRQFVAVCDGLGWGSMPKAFYNSRLFTMAGEPHEAKFEDVSGYPELAGRLKTESMQRYYGFGTLAVGKTIYQYLSTPNHQFSHPDSSPWPGGRFVGAKLIYSADNGRSWHNQDGSTPVVWEPWKERSRANMVFLEESQDAFALLSILQMGRAYSANQDGYVYVYSPNGSVEGTMNELVMFRVPKAQILHRRAYEYFGGLKGDGSARWAKHIEDRAVVHTFPSGWVNVQDHPWAWMLSLVYNTPLRLYMMTSWGTGMASDGTWFGKPSYLGLWIAQHPWGPWTQIHEETAWLPQNDSASRAFAPQISPKWISKDGRSLWIVWSDFQQKPHSMDFKRLKAEATTPEDTVRYYQAVATTMPYYAFNTQRIDLIIP